MTHDKPPHNVVPFERAKSKKVPKPGESELFNLLSKIDELEDALETLDDVGVTTREQLEELIGKLESEAAKLDDSGQS